MTGITNISKQHALNLNYLANTIHNSITQKWWHDLEKPEVKLDRNIGELLMLCVSELAEAMEGHRKNLMDDKLPHRTMFEVELADTIIRILDISAGLGLDIGNAVIEKLEYNKNRKDHTLEARRLPNGKKY